MFFTEKNRKKNLTFLFLALFLFSGVIFAFSDVHSAYAADGNNNCLTSVARERAGGFLNCFSNNFSDSNPVKMAFQWLLYSIFVLFGLLASLAVTIFEWAINPDNVQLLFNSPGVYESWKFVRDFFNLFFILILLYIAFMVIFQMEKNFKKTLLSLVLAALYINFSFPVSRALIDVTNVPMYFFSNQMMASNGGTGVFSSAMTASKIEGILLQNGSNSDISRLLMAIIFLFLFSITLLVLSVMFVIRLVALVILVIFSSVGFAASIVPGLSSYSKMWWENFWRYAFFGPAAMLMLLVATRFFASLNDEALMKSMQTVATGTAAGLNQTFFSSMALFSIPIIMLWMAMGLAQKFSIAGASSVVGQGKKFSAWAGKKTMNGGKWVAYKNPIARGIGSGVKDRFDNNKLTKFFKSPSKTEATIKGGIAGGWGGGAKERKKLDQQAVINRVKKDKENQVSNSTHRDNLKNSKNPIEREAAALALATDKEISTTEELSQAMDALKNNTDGLVKVIENAKSGAVKNMDSASFETMRDLHFEKDQNGNVIRDPVTHQATVREGMDKSLESFDHRIVKEGNANVLVDYQVNNTGVSRESAVDTVLVGINSAKEKVKQESLFADARNMAGVTRYVTGLSGAVRTELEKAAAQEAPNVHSIISAIP